MRKGGEKACSGAGESRLLIKEASPPAPGAHKPQRKERTQLLELHTKSNQAAPDNILSQALLLTLAFQFEVAENPLPRSVHFCLGSGPHSCVLINGVGANFCVYDDKHHPLLHPENTYTSKQEEREKKKRLTVAQKLSRNCQGPKQRLLKACKCLNKLANEQSQRLGEGKRQQWRTGLNFTVGGRCMWYTLQFHGELRRPPRCHELSNDSRLRTWSKCILCLKCPPSAPL